MLVSVPVSVGELVDKVTILRIKLARLPEHRRLNVAHELAFLEQVIRDDLPPGLVPDDLMADLQAVNARLWDIEDGKRHCERCADFGPDFIRLARQVYLENDRRAAIKREINRLSGSEIVEEKSYG